ncbi:HalD/BesD family halogenase [Paenibacillus methanolicus]|uniref:Fe2OG dioxygenase domain-containing protein n=1 Tax=Paenibacillus methanolicus TaxID=582686 RepID=A0A5S5C1Z6_9BACL|nr:hypothetical protein [Paenibacillus methanolicus]TYP72370.1 hypothetical protein BCM02_10824 [Paenibacillus methanolicus]
MNWQQSFDEAVEAHLSELEQQKKDELRLAFGERDMVVFDGLLPERLRDEMQEEALRLLRQHGRRRELHIQETGNTPRYFNSAGRQAIAEHGRYIPAFFASEPIKRFLAEINAGKPLFPVPYEPEEYIINSQQAMGDTHGWHWDDYTFALIWIVEAPAEGEGALVEYIPRTEWDRDDKANCVQKILESHETSRVCIPQGHCYLMKANTTLHRISPLTGSSRRTVIVFTYASEEDFQKDISHETMEQIWENEIKSGQEAIAASGS